jgi:predicted aspartyl protease
MIAKRGTKVSRFSVEFEVANYDDVIEAKHGHLAPNKIRRTRIRGVVDTGASRLVLPAAVARQLGLPRGAKAKVRYADGRRTVRNTVKDVFVTMQGREETFTAVVEENRKDALIGAIVLEAFDFLADCSAQRLVPRDPDYVVSELE